jgi:hypothetical protein
MRIALALASAAIALCPAVASAAAHPTAHQTPPVTVACWDEPNAAMPGGMERIGGDVTHMPTGSVLVPLPYPYCGGGGHTWVDPSVGAGFCPAGWSDVECGA